jgi:hypothetical protein
MTYADSLGSDRINNFGVVKRMFAGSPFLQEAGHCVYWNLCNTVNQVEAECGLWTCVHGVIFAAVSAKMTSKCIAHMNTEKQLNIKARAMVAAACSDSLELVFPAWLEKLYGLHQLVSRIME